MTAVTLVYMIVSMNVISLGPPSWSIPDYIAYDSTTQSTSPPVQNSTQSKLQLNKKTYHCRNLSTSILDKTTTVGIILLWTTWFGINFVESLGNSRPITCGPNKNKCFLTGDKNLYSNSSTVVFHIVESNLLSY